MHSRATVACKSDESKFSTGNDCSESDFETFFAMFMTIETIKIGIYLRKESSLRDIQITSLKAVTKIKQEGIPVDAYRLLADRMP